MRLNYNRKTDLKYIEEIFLREDNKFWIYEIYNDINKYRYIYPSQIKNLEDKYYKMIKNMYLLIPLTEEEDMWVRTKAKSFVDLIPVRPESERYKEPIQSQPKPKRVKSPDLIYGIILYIAIVLVTSIFYARIPLWLIETFVLIKWINKENNKWN